MATLNLYQWQIMNNLCIHIFFFLGRKHVTSQLCSKHSEFETKQFYIWWYELIVGSDPEPIPAPCFNNTDGFNEFLQIISRSSDQSVVPLDQQFHEKSGCFNCNLNYYSLIVFNSILILEESSSSRLCDSERISCGGFLQHLSIFDPVKHFLRFKGKQLVDEFHVFDIAIFVFLNAEQFYQLIRLFWLHFLG